MQQRKSKETPILRWKTLIVILAAAFIVALTLGHSQAIPAEVTSSYQPGQATNGTGVTIGVQAEDWAGRTGETSQVIKYDPSAPVITITGCSTPDGNSGWFTSQPTCTLSGQDTATGSGVTTLRRKIGSADWETVASSP